MKQEYLASCGPGCVCWVTALAVAYSPAQSMKETEIVEAASGLKSKGKQGFPETWFTVKLQTPLSFLLKPWWKGVALNVGKL